MIRNSAPAVSLPLIAVFAFGAIVAQDFDAEYRGMLEEFSDALPDTVAAEALIEQADALYDNVRQHRRDNRDSLSDEELDRLLELSREVRSFESVTRVVGQTHNAAETSFESFDRVSEQLGLEAQVLQTHESGLELVQFEIGGFVSLLLRNPTKTTYAISYGVNDPERPGGVGSAACESYSVLSGLFNSRDRELEGLEFTFDARATRAGSCN